MPHFPPQYMMLRQQLPPANPILQIPLSNPDSVNTTFAFKSTLVNLIDPGFAAVSCNLHSIGGARGTSRSAAPSYADASAVFSPSFFDSAEPLAASRIARESPPRKSSPERSWNGGGQQRFRPAQSRRCRQSPLRLRPPLLRRQQRRKLLRLLLRRTPSRGRRTPRNYRMPPTCKYRIVVVVAAKGLVP